MFFELRNAENEKMHVHVGPYMTEQITEKQN